MPRDAFVSKIQRELCHPKCARKVSGLTGNGSLGIWLKHTTHKKHETKYFAKNNLLFQLFHVIDVNKVWRLAKEAWTTCNKITTTYSWVIWVNCAFHLPSDKVGNWSYSQKKEYHVPQIDSWVTWVATLLTNSYQQVRSEVLPRYH